jgi:hypothetical protein
MKRDDVPFHKIKSAMMKGYFEHRGQSFKLRFDTEAKRFSAGPVAHDFQPAADLLPVTKVGVEPKKDYQAGKSRKRFARQVSAMGSEQREDGAVLEAHATS